MTEEEAKTKWCPFARVVASLINGDAVSNTQVRNRLVEIEAGQPQVYVETLVGAQCVASACMAWRTTARIPLSVAREIQKELALPLAQAWDHAASLFIADGKPDGEDGYCGLAGAPR